MCETRRSASHFRQADCHSFRCMAIVWLWDCSVISAMPAAGSEFFFQVRRALRQHQFTSRTNVGLQ